MSYINEQKNRKQIIIALIGFLIFIIVVTSATSIFQNATETSSVPIATAVENSVENNLQNDFLIAQFNDSLEEYKNALTRAEQSRDALNAELIAVKQQLASLQDELSSSKNSTVENIPSLSNETKQTKEEQTTVVNRRVHTVAAGETLSSISKLYYGSPKYAQRIYDANKEILPNKNRIKPGIQLVIP